VKKSLVVLLSIVCLACAGLVSADDDRGNVSDLWVDLSMGAPLVDLFNERAEPQDIARVEHISQLDLLEGVHAGKKLVVFKSAADAVRLLPHIHDKIDIVGYNLEHGPANPIFEQENPLESMKQLREVVDMYDLELALGPDHRFAESDGAALAPYADYFILQVQKVQTEPETVYEFVDPLIDQIREANPDIEISLQIRTEGDAEQLLELFAPLGDRIQGISILTSEDTLDVTEDLMKELRPSARLVTPEPTVEVVDISVSILTPQPLPTIGPDNSAPIREELLEASEPTAGPTEIVSTPVATERGGSTALFVVVALVVGIALGAGYVSYRTGS
jgi:hypothetical protein